MELRQLEMVLAVAEEGTFTAAARRVHVVQSAVSVAVRSLEHELGATLFERTTRRVTLTAAGEALLDPARAALAATVAAREAVAGIGDGTRGTIRVGIMHALPGIELAGLLGEFHRRRPLVHLLPTTSPEGSTGLVRGVVEGHLDLAFASTDVLSAQQPVHARELAREPIRLACPPGHRLAGRSAVEPGEIDGETFIDVPVGWGSRAAVDRFFAARGIARTVLVEVGDVATVLELVRAGLGLALVAPSSAPASAREHLVELDPHPSFAVAMVTPTGRAPSPATAGLVDLVERRHREAA